MLLQIEAVFHRSSTGEQLADVLGLSIDCSTIEASFSYSRTGVLLLVTGIDLDEDLRD